MFKVFRKRWKRAPIKPPKASIKEPQDVSSTGSDMFSNCDFDVEFRVGGRNEDSEIDKESFHRPVEQISLQESSPETSPGRRKNAKVPVSAIDFFSLFNDNEWVDVKRQLRRLQKNGDPREICRILTSRDSRNESILHIAAWKAPPRLFHFMVHMVPESNRTDCLLLEDKDGNTAFHLLCANLSADCVEFSFIEDTLMLDIGILKKQNAYGDTCLHLLIASEALSMSQPVQCNEEAAIEQLAVGILSQMETASLTACKNV